MSKRPVARLGTELLPLWLGLLCLAGCSSSAAPSIETLRAQIELIDERQDQEIHQCDGDPACIAEVNRRRHQDRVSLIESHLAELSAYWAGRPGVNSADALPAAPAKGKPTF